jgi:hypothetical protein
VTQGAYQPLQTILCEDEGVGRIVVDHEAFVRFASDLDASLARLTEQWRHLQPPPPMPNRQTIRRRPK